MSTHPFTLFSAFAAACCLVLTSSLQAQDRPPEPDPCGFALAKPADAAAWGYNVDSLHADLQRWSTDPRVEADVIGESVRGRSLYHLAITNPNATSKKFRIWMHARTHPIESESSLVARAVINELLSGSALAQRIIDNCVVHILPMLNPDGVELLNMRENANGVDLESNWGVAVPEPEVQALRRHLILLMQNEDPVDIALNLHSAYACKRYFVYHAAAGTSVLFTQMEQQYINDVRGHFPGGFEAWDYFVSWTTGTPDRYPESWFWRNYAERVMALTYEDMNCAEAGEFERTARALLAGSADYLGIAPVTDVRRPDAVADALAIETLYPHPVRRGTQAQIVISNRSYQPDARLTLYDLLGREIAQLWNGALRSGTSSITIPASALSPGTYLLRLTSGGRVVQHTVTLL